LKAFIIYVEGNKISEEYADKAIKSFSHFSGWAPSLFCGVTLDTLSIYEKKFNLKIKESSRAMDFFLNDQNRYLIKKCCSLNHYRLFKKCIELNEPIAIIEHDAHCMADWEDFNFDDVLVMNISSAVNQDVLKHLNLKAPITNGIFDINLGLNYRHDALLKHAHIMPGTASYAITPQGAKKMIEVYESIGWEQSDHILNTAYVKIKTIIPELFTFKLANLSMSHGKNL